MSTTDNEHRSDEITFKEAIHKAIDVWKEIKKNWILLVLFCIPFLALNIYKHITYKKKFPAALTFMVNEDGGSSMGALSSVLGQFGLGQSGEDNLEKILELSKSMNISKQAFFESKTIGGREDFLANHIISMLEEKGEWQQLRPFAKTPEYNLEGFQFAHDSIQSYSMLENKALKKLHQHILGSKKHDLMPLLSTEILESTNIMKLSSKCYNPEISVALCNGIYERLSNYYVDKTIEKHEHTYLILEEKTDSILTELKSKEYELAKFKDRNRGLFAKTDQLIEVRLSRDVQKLGLMYAEATKNMELANFALQNNTPFIQVIDRPFLPIPPEESSIVRKILNSLLIGFFLGASWIVVRMIFREALQ